MKTHYIYSYCILYFTKFYFIVGQMSSSSSSQLDDRSSWLDSSKSRSSDAPISSKSVISYVTKKSTYSSPAAADGNYPRYEARTASIHKRRQFPEYAVSELIRMDPIHLFFIGFIPPFFGAVGSIITVITYLKIVLFLQRLFLFLFRLCCCTTMKSG